MEQNNNLLYKYISAFLFSGGICLMLDTIFHIPDPYGPFILGGLVCTSFLMYEDFLKYRHSIAEKLLKYIILLHTGGSIYWLIEIFYRGYSHYSMYMLGGICFISCGMINEYFTWEMPLWKQMSISAVIITVLEFIVGLVVNIILKMNIWDYSNLPFNVLGQICLPFMVIWFFLSAVAIILDDYLRYAMFKEEKPRYKLF